MFTAKYLHQALAEVGVHDPGDIFEQLAIAYREPWRYYHTDVHIDDCLTQLEALKRQYTQLQPATWAVMAIALYFHDAVYLPQRHDNEAKSAQWAYRYLSRHGASPQTADQVSCLILTTTTHQATTSDAFIVLDIDLSILGASTPKFQTYDADIRREYSWVPQVDYNRQRSKVLAGFLAREHIYYTPWFQARYEAQARQNLAACIDALNCDR